MNQDLGDHTNVFPISNYIVKITSLASWGNLREKKNLVGMNRIVGQLDNMNVRKQKNSFV